ncbi:MAG: PAS domain-containing protein, partial [Pseudolabrys sp.]|nr:PAS domain-containing protein [Pseudolabrys sp.]
MSGASNIWLGDPRLAAHALSPAPAWLWSADATRILWANPTGAAIFEAASPSALDERRFEPDQPEASQIAQLAKTLPGGAMPRLERLKGFGADQDRALTCICSRISVESGEDGILVVATEQAGPDLTLEGRLRRAIGDLDEPVAAFSADGELLLASARARESLGAIRTLESMGAEALARNASRSGHASGRATIGDVTVDRLSAGNTIVLLLTIESAAAAPLHDSAPPIAAEPPMPVADAPPASDASPAAAEGAVAPIAFTRKGPPLRFVWQSDAEDRFLLESETFLELAGWSTKSALGSPWSEFAAALGLDRDGRIAAALASRSTWSGIALSWPVDGTDERVTVELSGLPVITRDQKFDGFRGFGVCRELDRLTLLAKRRENTRPAPTTTEPIVEQQPLAAETAAEKIDESATPNVVPFRPAPQDNAGALDQREQSAFNELARELSDRLKKGAKTPINDDDFGPERPEPIAEPDEQPPAPVARAAPQRDSRSEQTILDRLPVGILIYRLNDLLYANRAFLEWTDYPNLEALRAAGGLDSLFIETNAPPAGTKGAPTLTIATPGGKRMPVEGRLLQATWDGENALVLMLNITKAADKSADLAIRKIED